MGAGCPVMRAAALLCEGVGAVGGGVQARWAAGVERPQHVREGCCRSAVFLSSAVEPVSPAPGQAVTPPAVRLQRNATSAARRPSLLSPFPRHPSTRSPSTLVALAAQAGVLAGVAAGFGPEALTVHLGATSFILMNIVRRLNEQLAAGRASPSPDALACPQHRPCAQCARLAGPARRGTLVCLLPGSSQNPLMPSPSQSAVAFVLHWGLSRPELEGKPGRYAPITEFNSWSSLFPVEVGRCGSLC
jgi:hypothetical protein